MCGIAGIVSLGPRPIDPGRIKPMCNALRIAGRMTPVTPSFAGEKRSGEGGYWCGFADVKFHHVNEHLPVFDGPYCRDELAKSTFSVALGHRRLAILDLTHYGHQPMSSSDCRYWISYNGEVYNFPELRNDLRARGHVFRTRSDTEVILHLWEEHDAGCLPMLDGMFALAVYDRARNLLTLARDRFGVKPLYYGLTGDYLLFASEIKGILASTLLRPRILREPWWSTFPFRISSEPKPFSKTSCCSRRVSFWNCRRAWERPRDRAVITAAFLRPIRPWRGTLSWPIRWQNGSAGPSSGNWSATWRSDRTSLAAWTAGRSWRSRAGPSADC